MERITTPEFQYEHNEYAPHLVDFPLCEALSKLQKYEDTGLQPEEVAQLAELKAAGKLNIMPCAVGDTVYEIRTHYKIERKNKPYDYSISSMPHRLSLAPDTCYVAPKICTKTDMMHIGKTIFTTEAEAVRKLEEAKENARIEKNDKEAPRRRELCSSDGRAGWKTVPRAGR